MIYCSIIKPSSCHAAGSRGVVVTLECVHWDSAKFDQLQGGGLEEKYGEQIKQVRLSCSTRGQRSTTASRHKLSSRATSAVHCHVHICTAHSSRSTHVASGACQFAYSYLEANPQASNSQITAQLAAHVCSSCCSMAFTQPALPGHVLQRPAAPSNASGRKATH